MRSPLVRPLIMITGRGHRYRFVGRSGLVVAFEREHDLSDLIDDVMEVVHEFLPHLRAAENRNASLAAGCATRGMQLERSADTVHARVVGLSVLGLTLLFDHPSRTDAMWI